KKDSLDTDLPLVGLLRAPARLSVVVQLAVAILAAYGLAQVSQKLVTPWRTVLYSGLGILILFESLYQFPYPMYQDELAIPEIYKIIAQEDNNLAVLEIPSRARAEIAEPTRNHFLPVQGIHKSLAFSSMYLSTYHRHPLVGGEASRTPLAPRAFLDTTAFIRELTYPATVTDDDPVIDSTTDFRMLQYGGQALAQQQIGYVIIPRDRLFYLDASEKHIPEFMLRQALGAPFYEDEAFVGFRVEERPVQPPTESTLFLGDGWYPKAPLFDTMVQGMLQTGTLRVFEPEETEMHFSMTAFAVNPNYPRVTLLINDIPVETFAVSVDPQNPETHTTSSFTVPQGFTDIKFQVETDATTDRTDGQLYLGVYNLSQVVQATQ
ncbi:MAG: hypothetical protein AAF485_10245, partial [Chloroflexota bacterium]